MPEGPHADWLGPGAPPAPTTTFGKYGCFPYVVAAGMPLVCCMGLAIGVVQWTSVHLPGVYDFFVGLGDLLRNL